MDRRKTPIKVVQGGVKMVGLNDSDGINKV